ncbi:cyclic pyranopterin phosphate synthase MoaA [Paenibacillus sp. Root52]|uniref:GTP 3',8-cyclase n=1 Tax=Paenibacillus amylolyticus TaxID=1451 RepID=A0AAP5GXI7_PAEAM|nr:MULTISPECIES: GTP 3',8-cyclase MoaA [Paenibacillus]KQY94015.1 cyclic pyranopterin phosphate synthase MoaA [Paenibacillus sp. Root52]MDR6722027.1 cyclic pyranopterin phosphate synthase [Paenibacillus amylolyticus]
MESKLMDPFGRVHDYLRISVTDRCNLRCVYCMPEEGMQFEPTERILSYEEITSIVKALAPLGIRKLRLTGGEPLVRKGLDQLIAMLSAIPGIEDIALTTNGIYLAAYADRLKSAGLTRVNISLDSLKPERFARITRGGKVDRVLDGIIASQRAGFQPIKLNVVLMKGVNDDEVEDFLRMTLEAPIDIRFIEYMPIGDSGSSWKSSYMPLEHVLKTCGDKWNYESCGDVYGNGPADSYRIAGAAGTFGLIHPVSSHFCGSCNRLRLTADGNIKPCLYWSDEYNVRPLVGDDKAVQDLFYKALGSKPETHDMVKALKGQQIDGTPTLRHMSQIGG